MNRRLRIGCWSAMGGLFVIAGACLVSMFLQPPTWRVTRSRTIQAPAARVREQLIDLHRYVACCGTPEAQSNEGTRFSSTSEGPGAWAEWNAPGGVERITITSVGADRIVTNYVVAGIGTEQTIRWRAIGERTTEVTWVIDGNKSGFLQRLVWPVARVEPNVSDAIDTSLGGLERAAR